jgi:hypothetical protein
VGGQGWQLLQLLRLNVLKMHGQLLVAKLLLM